jgi:hypothetical protein
LLLGELLSPSLEGQQVSLGPLDKFVTLEVAPEAFLVLVGEEPFQIADDLGAFSFDASASFQLAVHPA